MLEPKLAFLPGDAELISYASHKTYKSETEGKVYRVDVMDDLTSSTRVADSYRSHVLSWRLGKKHRLNVLAPLTSKPLIQDGHMVTVMPAGEPLTGTLTTDEAHQLGVTMGKWSTLYSDKEDMLQSLHVDEYVKQRLQFSKLNQSAALRACSEETFRLVRLLEQKMPFDRLRLILPGYVHGDLHKGNFLYHEAQLKVIDFDSFKFASPLYDIGTLRYQERMKQENNEVSTATLEGLLGVINSQRLRRKVVVDERTLQLAEAWKHVSAISRQLCISGGHEEHVDEIRQKNLLLAALLK